jgi:hypothetical protein
MRSQMIAFAVFVFVLAYPLSPNAELIEPTRTLQETVNAPGNLTILSEPPDLDVTLDDTRIGKTPAFLKNIKSGIHRLRVEDSETEIYLEPGGTLQISLFKGEFINIPVTEKKPVKQQALKEKQAHETRTIQQSPKEEQKNDLTPWEKFINRSLNHF